MDVERPRDDDKICNGLASIEDIELSEINNEAAIIRKSNLPLVSMSSELSSPPFILRSAQSPIMGMLIDQGTGILFSPILLTYLLHIYAYVAITGT